VVTTSLSRATAALLAAGLLWACGADDAAPAPVTDTGEDTLPPEDTSAPLDTVAVSDTASDTGGAEVVDVDEVDVDEVADDTGSPAPDAVADTTSEDAESVADTTSDDAESVSHASDAATTPDTADTGEPLHFERPANASCHAFDRPAVGGQVGLVGHFGDQCIGCWVQGNQLVGMVMPPHRGDVWYLYAQRGVVERVDHDPQGLTHRVTALDIASRVDFSGEKGLLGLAFEPGFDGSGYVYAFYVNDAAPPVDHDSVSRIVRFWLDEGALPADPASEQVILEIPQRFSNHKGGDLHFGPDGMLYVSVGDAGYQSWPTPWTAHPSQDLGSLLGKILRLDVVDQTTYAIPPDNPFVGQVGARGEVFAYGLRNPWRFSVDGPSGRIFAGDVGEGSWEEINEIVAGGNYGWPVREGLACMPAYPAGSCAADSVGAIDPIAVNQTGLANEGVSIIGGHVYRGDAMPSLRGAYLYGDWLDSRLWSLVEDPITGAWVKSVALASGAGQVSFAVDHAGELYLVNQHGPVKRLVAAGAPPVSDFPERLSETGCAGPHPSAPSAGMIGYVIHAELFSDYSAKARYLALPDETHVEVGPGGDLLFPIGSVLRKDFALGGDLVETRLLVRHDDGAWSGYSYRWDEDGADAHYVGPGAREEVGGQTWTYPSSGQCLSCHTQAAERTLGPELAQLHGRHPEDHGVSELERFVTMGLFAAAGAAADPPPPLARLDDEEATLGARARSYLHANCASCHRPGGGAAGGFDLRFGTPFAAQGLCDAHPERGDFGLGPDARILRPGSPEQSVLLARLRATGPGRMPPLTRELEHLEAAAVIGAWIAGFSGCP